MTAASEGLIAIPLTQVTAFSSATLRGQLTDETGTGLAVFATTPTLTTPVLGVATATSINGNTVPVAMDTVVLLAATQTLTNKTLTAPTINTGAMGAASTATTQPVGTSNTTLATTAFVQAGASRQTVSSFVTGVVASGAYTQWAPTDTIPDNTGGIELTTLAITPASAAGKLVIDVVVNYVSSGSCVMAVALFQDATANSFATQYSWVSANGFGQVVLRAVVASGSTTARTYKLRMGSTSGGAVAFSVNSLDGVNRAFGGTLQSGITISESF
jgi:hypothetical protein